METPPPTGHDDGRGPHERLRFAPFEVDLRTGELWRDGEPVRLQNQPFRVLAALLARPGELVTRAELRRGIWPDGTFVDFESSLNFCVRQIRAALGDQASSPRYVETLPRRGYRFVAPVERVPEPAPPVAAALPAPSPPALPPPDPRPRRRAGKLAALALMAVALTAAFAANRTQSEPAAPEVRFQRVTFRRGFVDSARFAPGGVVAYAAGWEGSAPRLHLLNAATREDRPVNADVAEVLATTAAGEVLYRSGGTLCRVSLRGGPAKELARRVLAADTTADGNEVALARVADGRVQVELPLGHVLATVRTVSHLRLSPDAQRVAFFEHPFFGDDRGDVVVLDRDGRRRVLTTGWSSTTGLAWSPDGREVWFTAAAEGIDAGLHAVDLDGGRRPLAPALGRLVIHDVAPDGRVLVERNTERLEARAGTHGGPERDLSWMDATLVTDISPDGERLLFVESGEAGGADYSAYLRGLADGSPPVRLGPGRAMALSPDGRWVASVLPRDPEEIKLLPVGPGEGRSLRHADGVHVDVATFLPDGRLLYATRDHEGRRQTFVRDVAGGTPRAVAGEGALLGRAVTRDGRAVVMATADGPRLVTIDGSAPPARVPGLGRGRPLAWVGADLLVHEPGWLPAIVSRLRPDGTRTPWLALAPEDLTGVVGAGNIVLSADGRRYAYTLVRRTSDLYVLTGIA